MIDRAPDVERYGLAPAMERAVAWHCTRSPRFLGFLGTVLEPDAFRQKEVALVVKAAQAIFRDLGRGPSSASTVFQRLHRWLQEGNVSKPEIDSAADMLAEVPLPVPTEDEVVKELAPILKHRVQDGAAKQLLDDLANKREPDRTVKMLQASKRIGVVDQDLGLAMSPEGIDDVAAAGSGECIGFGVSELDALLSGGVYGGSLTVICASSGHGKTQTLVHFAARAMCLGKSVGYLVLEGSAARIFARVAANLLMLPTRAVLRDKAVQAEARAKLARVLPSLGPLTIKKMPGMVTTLVDVRAWIERLEEHRKGKLDVLVLDYADLLKSHLAEDRDNRYAAMGTVYQDLQLWAEDGGRWAVTASQAKRGASSRRTRGKRVEAEDVSDSLEKLRKTDYLVTQSLDEQTNEVSYMLGKHRDGDNQGAKTPSLPHDWGCSRMVPGPLDPRVAAVLSR